MVRLLRVFFSFAGFLLMLIGCAVVPETGRRQLNWLPADEEAQAGLQAFQEYKKKQPIAANQAIQEQVRRVGHRIASIINDPHAGWEFVAFEDATPNAFALPGGKVGIHTGLLPIARDDAGIAAIISHEIAHVVARHSGERRSQKSLAQLGLAMLGVTIPETKAFNTGIGVGAQLGLLRYSRVHELEADRLGAIYMARAGYDPREAVAFWRRFAEYKRSSEGTSRSVEFLSTHPLDERRIEALEAFMPQALAEFQATF